jgi:hypothetical protein
MSNFEEKKPHAVLTPFPVQGHINALLKLAKLLHLRGFHITFVNTEYNHKRLLKSRGEHAFEGFTDFTFETIPDGLTPKDGDIDGDVSQDLHSLGESIITNFRRFFDELLAKLHESATAGLIPPVTCLVSDCYMPFTVDAAEELALPIVLFAPCSASYFLACLLSPKMYQNSQLPFKGNHLCSLFLLKRFVCVFVCMLWFLKKVLWSQYEPNVKVVMSL